MAQSFDQDSEDIITRAIEYFNDFNDKIEHYNSFHLRMQEINEKKINREQLNPYDLAFEEEYDNLTYMDLDLENLFDFHSFRFSKNLNRPQDLADFFIDKIRDIEEYYSDLTFYSSYTTKQPDLFNKNLCWFTNRIDQSILFPFDISRLDIFNAETNEPHMYSFRINRSLKLINSKSNHNMEIFDKFFPFGKYFHQKFIKYVFNEDLYNQETFAVVKNKRILYIIEAINRFINSKKSRFQKIDGYKNDLDQCEIAVIGFSNLVDRQSIREYQITEIGRTGNFFKLPIIQNQLDDFFLTIGNIIYDIKSKSRMTCPENLIIKYINTNGLEPEQIFNCSCMPIDVWQKKYLKYKTKYLKLKSFIR
jgi:hypothetical protein